MIGDQTLDQLKAAERKQYSLRREKVTDSNLSDNATGDWLMSQAQAVPFYFKFLFADRQGLFNFCVLPIAQLEELLEQLQKHGSSWPPPPSSARSKKQEHDVITEACHLWSYMSSRVDICVIPKLMGFSFKHTPEEWSAQTDSTSVGPCCVGEAQLIQMH